MSKLVTAEQAAALIPDGATVGVTGMGLAGWPEEIGCAIRDHFRETGHPRGLFLRQGCNLGDWIERGVTRLGEAGPGLVTKWCGAHVGSGFALRKLAAENQLELYLIPQGIEVNLWREIAAGRPGLLSKVGLGTFVDPRQGGGRINACAKDEIVKLVQFEGEEYLFYKSFPVHVALIRGTTADENGNLTLTHECLDHEALPLAMAAKNSGGIVIVQAEYIAKAGTLNPNRVAVPGIFVDYVVQATRKDACFQTERTYYDPALCGELRKPFAAIAPLPLSERKVIARRCATELRHGDLINLGVGIPGGIASVVNEETDANDFCMITEGGLIGGVPASEHDFGASYNAESRIDHGYMFDFIDGGGLNLTCLGIGEIDEEGNNNVSWLGDMVMGPGGFVNITQSTPTIIFCGTFMNKAKLQIGGGKLTILEEGKTPKFVKKVKQISFSGKYAGKDQKILYVTERAVFRLIDGKMTLLEYAPGIDLQKDVLDKMGFRPEISPDLKQMDPGMFSEKWGRLEEYLSRNG